MEWHAGYQCCHHGSTDYCNTTYSVTVTDADDCTDTEIVTVQVYIVQPPVITYDSDSGLSNNDGTICAGSDAMVNISGAVSYVWSDGSISLLAYIHARVYHPLTI
jgi:hypothetical protein